MKDVTNTISIETKDGHDWVSAPMFSQPTTPNEARQMIPAIIDRFPGLGTRSWRIVRTTVTTEKAVLTIKAEG